MKKQKIYGAILVVLALIIPFISDGDITASLLILPLGLYAIFTKQYILNEERGDENE